MILICSELLRSRKLECLVNVMIRIAVVEDNSECAERLIKFLNRFANENDQQFEIVAFRDGMDIIKLYRSNWDIIFMDIEMPLLNGMDAAREIRKSDPVVIIIFVTQMAHYAIHGYEVDAMDFILKPIHYFPFSLKLKKAISKIENQKSEEMVFLPTAGSTKRIPVKEIYYLAMDDHKLMFHTTEGVFSVSGTLKHWEEILLPFHFARCNSGYLVNLDKVTVYKKDEVVVGGDTLIVSRPRRKEFFGVFSDYIGGTK